MLNYMDKAGFTLIAGGVLGQFFVSTDTLVRGCTVEHSTTGVWTVTLPQGISKPNYIFVASPLTGFSPSISVQMTDIDATHKFILIRNGSDGTSMDVDVSFLMFEIPAGG